MRENIQTQNNIPQLFPIFLKNLNGNTVLFNVDANENVHSLKIKIQDKAGVPLNQQRLVYAGKQLHDEHLLADYNILKDSTLHLVLRLTGGFLQTL